VYNIGREAFMIWVHADKPRSGAKHSHMCKTRAAFKLAVRYCHRHREQLKADATARNLLDSCN